MDLSSAVKTTQSMLILLFWMLGLCQVVMSHLIVWHGRASKARPASSVANSQRKDDILAAFVMGATMVAHYSKVGGLVYLITIFIMVWISRRTKTRLDLLKPEK